MRGRSSWWRTCWVLFAALPIPIAGGCVDGSGNGESVYNNTTDRTNGNSSFLGSAACGACHPDIAASHSIHGHANILTRVQGQPPAFPAAATRAKVPNPPTGYDWSDIAYVLGGYRSKALFLDDNGYLLVDGVAGVNTQWNLAFPGNGTAAGFVAYEAGTTTPKPYDYSCFVCHTTGPQPQSAGVPEFQENRRGIVGTWHEAGVQCEACHGPGSRHVGNPAARNEFVDTSAKLCGECHSRPFGSTDGVIRAAGGFIQSYQQYPEMLASGGHAAFECVTCHDPHASAAYDKAEAIRNRCTDCHTDKDMALHEGRVFARGDYTETLTCESCHMPYATSSASSRIAGTSGGRIGDVRTHIFRINTDLVDYTTMFTDDMTAVRKDASGKAAVTVDFVCLRCHNNEASFPFELTVTSASNIAVGMHRFTSGQ